MIIEADIKALNELIKADDTISGSYGSFLLPCVITVNRGVVETVAIDIPHWGPPRHLKLEESRAALVTDGQIAANETGPRINYYRAVVRALDGIGRGSQTAEESKVPSDAVCVATENTVHLYLDCIQGKEA